MLKKEKTGYETILASIQNATPSNTPQTNSLIDSVLSGTPYTPNSYDENLNQHEENEYEEYGLSL